MAIERFVDAHIHLWDLQHIRYPWLTGPFSDDGVNGSVEPIAQTYLVEDYLNDAGAYKPVAAVHIDAGANPDDALKETAWLQGLADQGGIPQAIVAYAPLHEPEVETLLASHCRYPDVRGIRQILNWHPNAFYTYTPRNFMGDPQWEKGFALLGKYNLSFDLQIYPLQLAQIARLGGKYDHIPLMLNHMGMPINDHEDAQKIWIAGLKDLARLPLASVKISGFGFVERKWTVESMRPLVLRIIDIFGPERVMFASDFPTDKLFASFAQVMEAFEAITDDFSASERDAMFATNAARLYRIDISKST
jgi:predicted TIM-barrel fold metal-dependent hydrolase